MTELVGHVKAAATGAAAQTCMQAVAACAKALGFRFGPYIGTVLPMVTERCRAASATVDADSGLGVEEKEAALHATTALVQFCSDVRLPRCACTQACKLASASGMHSGSPARGCSTNERLRWRGVPQTAPIAGTLTDAAPLMDMAPQACMHTTALEELLLLCPVLLCSLELVEFKPTVLPRMELTLSLGRVAHANTLGGLP